jgi:hypothetical protein
LWCHGTRDIVEKKRPFHTNSSGTGQAYTSGQHTGRCVVFLQQFASERMSFDFDIDCIGSRVNKHPFSYTCFVVSIAKWNMYIIVVAIAV